VSEMRREEAGSGWIDLVLELRCFGGFVQLLEVGGCERASAAGRGKLQHPEVSTRGAMGQGANGLSLRQR